MTGKLEFDLPEERCEFAVAVNAMRIAGGIWDFEQWLRGRLRHGDLSSAENAVYEEVLRELREHVNVDDMLE